MLKLARPIDRKVSSYHEEIFVQQYDRLLEFALRITQGDKVAAEDLVQEAFVQFTFACPDIDSIKYFEAYLCGMLRNLHLMDLRRATHRRSEPLALIDFDSVEIGLRARDFSQVMQTRNELALICRYACRRKRSSKAGSVLILRFFHGYYPSEISQVIQSSRPVVSELLLVGRNEARRFTEDPRSLSFIGESNDAADIPLETGLSYPQMLNGLRSTIFRSRTGICPSMSELEAVYRVLRKKPVDIAVLDHLVSCVRCLDSVNHLLNLPLLAERNPTDMLSPHRPDKDGGSGTDGPDDSGNGGNDLDEIRQKCRRRARRVYEHEPRELCLSVNGDRQFWQKIASATAQQTFSLEPSENIELIEVSSEQGIRLLLMQVEEVALQSNELELSDGRLLRVSLDRSTSRPRLSVCYQDPNFQSESVDQLVSRSGTASDNDASSMKTGWFARFREWSASITTKVSVPAAITVITVSLLLAGLLVLRSWQRSEVVNAPAAEELLQRSSLAEQALLTRTDTILHRSIKVERKEHLPAAKPAQTSLHRIEIWRSAGSGITARRLFNHQNQLVAGLWQGNDGTQTFYQHGKAPAVKLAGTINQRHISLATFWQEEPSAETFKQLVGAANNKLKIEELASTYLISYVPATVDRSALIKASVVLAKADLHVTEMTVVVNESPAGSSSSTGSRPVEYHFTEASFERHSPSTVAPSAFEPEKELLSYEPNILTKPAAVSSTTNAIESVLRPVATADLEVELLKLLHDVGADLGEQITVTRNREGFLRLAGVVETAERKTEILLALNPVIDSQVVRVELETVADALKRQARVVPKEQPVTINRSITSEPATMPVEGELRKYFAGEGDRAAELSQQYAMRIVARSRQSMTYVYALKRLLRQFSAAEFREMSIDARIKWLTLVQSHARAYKAELDLLRGDLNPVFFAPLPLSAGETVAQTESVSAAATAEQLVALATANDRIIRYSFTTSNNWSSQRTVHGPEFWQSLEQAIRLAALIVNSGF